MENVDDLIREVIKQASERVALDPSISPANRNKEIIGELLQKGIFNLKDAVIKVATAAQLRPGEQVRLRWA